MPDNSNAGLDSPRAWVVVFAAFLGAFVGFGLTYSFGVFLKPMALEFHVSHAAMSVLFSTIAGLSFFLAPFTGDLADHYGPRPVVAAGAVLIGAGLILTARVHSFPLVMVTYGGGLGAAVACTYIPSVAAVGEWFKVHRDIALGIAISGIGCGTLVAAPVSAMLIERYGWRTSFEIFGWTSAGLLLLCAALLARPPVAGKKKKVSVEGKVRTRAFSLMYISLFFAGIAVYVSFVFLPAYAADIGASRVAGATLIGYIGAASVIGRLGLNALAPRFGLLTMYQVAYFLLLVSFGLWLTAHSYASLVGFSLVMGVGYGGIAAMAPAVACNIFGIEGLGELLGILFTGFGVACVVGPPLAGVLVDHTLDYKWPVFVAAGGATFALLVVIPLRRYRAGSTEAPACVPVARQAGAPAGADLDEPA
jgi:MFS family permease